MEHAKGDTVLIGMTGEVGIIGEVFENFEKLVEFDDFETLADGYKWLAMQRFSYQDKHLEEPWYMISLFTGGEIMTCHSLLYLLSYSQH